MHQTKVRSSHQRSMKKGILRNFVKFTEKPLCQSLFFNKNAKACSLIKKDTLAQVFSYEFYKISKNIFFTEHLWATASVKLCQKLIFLIELLKPGSTPLKLASKTMRSFIEIQSSRTIVYKVNT